MHTGGTTSLPLRFNSDFLVRTKCKLHSYIFAVESIRNSSAQCFKPAWCSNFSNLFKGFNATICDQVTEPAFQLDYLIDMCTGKARMAIKYLSIAIPPSLGMKKFWKCFTIDLVRSILSLKPTSIQSPTALR